MDFWKSFFKKEDFEKISRWKISQGSPSEFKLKIYRREFKKAIFLKTVYISAHWSGSILLNYLIVRIVCCWQTILMKCHTLFFLDVTKFVFCCSRDCPLRVNLIPVDIGEDSHEISYLVFLFDVTKFVIWLIWKA